MDTEKFYNDWAIKELENNKRKRILKWKATNLLTLYFRNPEIECETICEIGGAEAIVLDTIHSQIGSTTANNFDISKIFCDVGEKIYPDISFRNYDFLKKPEFHDLVVLSDITEHVDDDQIFLEKVSEYCKYVLIKIPIEKCFFSSKLFHLLAFKKIPATLKYGPDHVNGHLRGYTVGQAKKYVSKYYEILDYNLSEVLYFNSNRMKRLIRKLFGKHIYILLYGGAFFGLGKSINLKNN